RLDLRHAVPPREVRRTRPRHLRELRSEPRMIVIPAIDLSEGRVVRLVRGDPRETTRYGEDPVAAARRFEREGATILHVVDLDAALGTGANRIALEAVCNAVDIPVQVGGGIRTREAIGDALGLGAARAILGSAAVWSAE